MRKIKSFLAVLLALVMVITIAPVNRASADGTEGQIPTPSTTKSVTNNHDGTYTIELNITGATVTEDNSHYANVLIILDATRSMRGNKWTNAKAAMEALIETLTEGENAQNAGKIDFALVTFGREATVTQGWTKNNTAFKTTCAGINMVTTSGTNWEAGMRGGLYGVLNSKPDDDPTYVIFLTDGDPNVYYSSGATTNYTNNGTTSGYTQNADTSATHSADEAKAIAQDNKLYGIYCGDSGTTPSGDSYDRLVNVITGSGQGGVKTISANADTIEDEFKAIAQTMLDEMGANNVVVDDGVPSYASIGSVQASVTEGEVSNYQYYKVENGVETVWNNAPAAEYDPEKGGVIWDLSSENSLSPDVTYRIRFMVWPSQDALDRVADLNNGLEPAYNQNDRDKGIIYDEVSGLYTMPTNTHLKTNYKFKDEPYTENNTYPSSNMDLPVESFTISKTWDENKVDDRSESKVDLYVTKDGENYLYGDDHKITLSEDNNWQSDPIYISCGFMTVDDDGNVTIKEEGRDYTVIESDDYSYRWELTADTYHPMIINGQATMLILKDDADSDYYTINGHKYVKTDSETNELTANNSRRSNLNITKVLDAAGADPDAMFKYTITVNDAKDDEVWFSVYSALEGGSAVDGAVVSDNVTPEKDVTGSYSVPSDEEFTVSIKAGWNIRFTNLPAGSTYTIEETDMPEGYEFKNVEASIYKGADKEIEKAETTGKLITGEIEQSNTAYLVTYTNTYTKFFYVYHSSDCTIERIPMNDPRVQSGKFNLVKEVKADHLYGGYYSAYAGTTATDDEIRELKYESSDNKAYTYVADKTATSNWATDSKGNPYTGAVATYWKNKAAITTAPGNVLEPVVNTVYYLKEVPDQYFRPALYYVYDDRAENKDLKKIYLILPTDDSLYQYVCGEPISLSQNKRLATTFKVTAFDGTSKSFKVKDINSNLPRGYIATWDLGNTLIAENSSYTWTPYFVTKDGVKVTSVVKRTFTFGTTIGLEDFESSDVKILSTYSVE